MNHRWAITWPSWLRYVLCCGVMLTAFGGVWGAIQQASRHTGGESYAYLKPGFVYPATPEGDLVMTFLTHHGRHPLYDLRIRVVDLDHWHEDLAQHPNGLVPRGRYERYYAWPRLDPHTSLPFRTWELPKDRDEQSYDIEIVSARHPTRRVSQHIRFRQIDGAWQVALRVIRSHHVLHEEAWQSFPYEENGRTVWEGGMGRWAR